MGVLNGIKILDFSTLLPGPFATLMLADMGAEVLRISSKKKLDMTLEKPPRIEGTDMNALAASLGRNKKTLSLNLKDEEAKKIVKELILEYDIILEQFRPGVMKKLGLDYNTLKEINPRIIYCSLTGYGQTGPLSMRSGHDINYLSRSGIISYSGKKGEVPSLYGMQIADLAGGSMNSVVGILGAVIYRNQTGKGQYIDISMLDCVIPYTVGVGAASLVDGSIPSPQSERTNGKGLYDFYETNDNRYISVGSLEPKFFKEFCNAIQIPDIAYEGCTPEDADEIKKRVSNRIKEKSLKEWMDIFTQIDACVEPVIKYDELVYDGQLASRNMFIDVVVPGTNGVKVRQIANGIKFSEAPNEYKYAGCPVGFHTLDVMKNLGYSDNEINVLENKGVFS